MYNLFSECLSVVEERDYDLGMSKSSIITLISKYRSVTSSR